MADAGATAAAGEALGRLLVGGDVIALVGELGAGKTSFTRGLAVGAGVEAEDVASPTFALVNEYRGRIAVAHADLYRLERERELDEIGWDDLVERRDAAVVIEWADRFPHRLPAEHVRVTLAYDGDGRMLEATATGLRATALLERWAAVDAG
ncbi:MAG TPA: tRNA (adenosine(37)-N6)-threonylcarbamoyltransferase complex ATPase subunit type 1 TsaE [Kofleriaceae bacterium]|nr:tRNA (adenosine(37)-N6)-threonylcarbamoyltransferase complex ATPase subunit type 1 TsaE [Kofleriaceae bacterium]